MSNVMTSEEGRPAHDQCTGLRGWLQPSVSIADNPEGYTLEAEMPGVSKDGLDVLLEGNELTIIGRRSHSEANGELVYRESYDRDFRRSFELNPEIDTRRISARMKNGVLFLELPKAESVKPRKITVE